MRTTTKRLLAAGGVVGPAGFVTAWSVLGATTSRPYSPVHDAISRLAEVGAPTRPGMTLGFVAFGVGLPLFGAALRDELPGPAWTTAVATGLATLGVAATPLGRSGTVDLVHGAFATAGYVTLAATPWLAAPHLAGRRAAGLARTAALVSAAALASTVVAPGHGLLQRIGLTAGDAWVVGMAVRMLRRP